MSYSEDTLYVVGDAKSPQNNPITEKFKAYFLALVIDRKTHLIVDVECSTTLALTNRFIREFFIGQHIQNNDIGTQITQRYLGSSQKALIVAFKDAQKKYAQHLQRDPQ